MLISRHNFACLDFVIVFKGLKGFVCQTQPTHDYNRMGIELDTSLCRKIKAITHGKRGMDHTTHVCHTFSILYIQLPFYINGL